MKEKLTHPKEQLPLSLSGEADELKSVRSKKSEKLPGRKMI